MPDIAALSMDPVFSSPNIEHLHAHVVPQALNEFFRVLTSPDLQAVAATLSAKRPDRFDLWAFASKSERTELEMRRLASQHFPAPVNGRKSAAILPVGS